jgi:hypothetical protein
MPSTGFVPRIVLSFEASVGDGLAPPRFGRAQHRVADLCRAVTVLEGGAARGDVGVVADSGEQTRTDVRRVRAL